MIAEEISLTKEQPKFSISENDVILLIIQLMKENVHYFKQSITSGAYEKKNLNEDDLTQIYVQQAQILIANQGYPFLIDKQYKDLHYGSKGVTDLYFFPHEQGGVPQSLFSVECKRLPAPTKNRAKEYVIGNKNNGGIERFKTEKHGKGLTKCGMIGFVEQYDKVYWLRMINSWISDNAKHDVTWNNDEKLSEFESEVDYCVLKSIVHRCNLASDVNMIHLWITLD